MAHCNAGLRGGPYNEALRGALSSVVRKTVPCNAVLNGGPRNAALRGPPCHAARKRAPYSAALKGPPGNAAINQLLGAPCNAAPRGAHCNAAPRGALCIGTAHHSEAPRELCFGRSSRWNRCVWRTWSGATLRCVPSITDSCTETNTSCSTYPPLLCFRPSLDR